MSSQPNSYISHWLAYKIVDFEQTEKDDANRTCCRRLLVVVVAGREALKGPKIHIITSKYYT